MHNTAMTCEKRIGYRKKTPLAFIEEPNGGFLPKDSLAEKDKKRETSRIQSSGKQTPGHLCLNFQTHSGKMNTLDEQ